MGKVAKVLGLGVKGSLNVVLDRSHYTAGDMMLGSVVLRVTEPFDFTSLVLRICGKEMLTWTETGGQVAAIFVREYRHLDEEVVLSTEQQSYQPGEYVYPISFHLRDTLSNSFHISGRDAGVMCRIDASLSYAATAIMTVKGKFSADMEAKKSFVVQQPPVGEPVCSLRNSITTDIYMLRMLKKGTCSISAQLPSNVHVAGDILQAQAQIHNDTSRDINKLSMMLYEDITVDLGVKAGKTREQVLKLPLVTKTSPARPVSAVIQSHFLTTKYRLVIKCKFRFCRSVWVDLPVGILRKLVVGAAHIPAAAVLPAITATATLQLDTNVGVIAVAAAPRRKLASEGRSWRKTVNSVRSPTSTLE